MNRAGILGAAAMLAWLGQTASAETWLNDKEIIYVFVGREVNGEYRNGVPFSEIYRKTGAIEYVENGKTASGKWSVRPQTFCTEYDGLPGGCFRIAMRGTNCFEYWLLGQDGVPKETTWIARSWQARYSATCPAR